MNYTAAKKADFPRIMKTEFPEGGTRGDYTPQKICKLGGQIRGQS